MVKVVPFLMALPILIVFTTRYYHLMITMVIKMNPR